MLSLAKVALFFTPILLCFNTVSCCFIDLCGLPGICDGRQCRMKPNCQEVECYCDETSTHSSCLTPIIDCPCSHGYCNMTDTNETLCVCEEGYQGSNCSEIVCPVDFNPCEFSEACPGEECRMLPNCSFECYCDENSTSCVTSPPENTPETPEYNPCNANFVYRNLTERTCGTGMDTCIYGKCVLENHTAMCMCDEGAWGVRCDHECCLNCGLHGECRIHDQIGEYCHCFGNYTGDKCDIITPEYNPCFANFTGRTLLERYCEDVGLSCQYGQCVKINSSSACHCDKGSDGYLCLRQCCLDCGLHGECRWNDKDKVEYCNCLHNYTGDRCNSRKPTYGPIEEVTWYLWVVGVCVVVLTLLIVVTLLVPYMMWKHRVILVMKLVYFFQIYEDDDDRTWDAFVSFRSIKRDESFIVETLRPKLEEELGFTLCLHFRDFIPGATISDNIIRAVKESRRTILLISPEYIQSEWTKLEYEVAQQEMLKRKHRIIPVLLDDISNFKSSMDPTLKNILSSVTYLEWPGVNSNEKKTDKFWKRLQLSLPKKRSNSDTNRTNPDDGFSKPDDIKVPSDLIKDKCINGSVNKSYFSNPDDDYDTIPVDEYDKINENEMDEYINQKNTTKTSSHNVAGEGTYIKILDDITYC